MTAQDASEITPVEELIRIQCSLCYKEVGHRGHREHAFDLIQKMGWKVGKQIICPQCVEKTARKFFKHYSE